MILNNIQKILAIGRTLRNTNVGDIVSFKPYNSKSIHEKLFYYSVLENSRNVLQEYAIKNREFHLKSSK